MMRKRIVDYKVVISPEGDDDLCKKVRALLQEGWQPFRGATYVNTWWYETLVKYGEGNCDDDEIFDSSSLAGSGIPSLWGNGDTRTGEQSSD